MPLNTQALTTVARFKSYVGITVPTYDTKIEILINIVTDFIEKYCDRRFRETTYTNQIHDGHGSPQLLLQQYPVNTRNAFQLDERDTDLNENQWSSVETNLYHIDYTAGLLELIGRKFAEVPRKYQVTYTAGYAFDNTTPGATLESLGIGELEWVCWELVNDLYKNAGSVTGVMSESIGNYSVSYGGLTANGLNPLHKSVLDKYKRPHLM